jgi:hypothetical protein
MRYYLEVILRRRLGIYSDHVHGKIRRPSRCDDLLVDDKVIK